MWALISYNNYQTFVLSLVFIIRDLIFGKNHYSLGSGTLSLINVEKADDKLQQVTLNRGDVYRLSTGTVFYLQNNVDKSYKSYAYRPQKLQIYAIFPGSEYNLHV